MKRTTIGMLLALSSATTLASAQPPPTATQMAERLQAVQAIAQVDWCGLAIPNEFVTALLAAAIQSGSSPNWVSQRLDAFEEEVQIASLHKTDICKRDAALLASMGAALRLRAQIEERLERAIGDLRGDKRQSEQYDAFMDWLSSLAEGGYPIRDFETLILNSLGERTPRPDELPFFVYDDGLAQALDRAFKFHLEESCRAKLTDSVAIRSSLWRHGVPRRADTDQGLIMMSAAEELKLLIMSRAHTQGEILCSQDSASALLQLIPPAIERSTLLKEITIAERLVEQERQASFVEISHDFHHLTTALLRGPPGGPIPAIVETAHAIEAGRLPMSAADVELIISSTPYWILGQQRHPSIRRHGDGKATRLRLQPHRVRRTLDLDATVTLNFTPIGSCDAPSSARTRTLQLTDPVGGDPEKIARSQEAVEGNHGHCTPARPISPLVSRFGGTYTGLVRALPPQLISALDAGFGPVLYLCGHDFTGMYMTGGWDDFISFAIRTDTSSHSAATVRSADGLCRARRELPPPGTRRLEANLWRAYTRSSTLIGGAEWRSPAPPSPSPSRWGEYSWWDFRTERCLRPDVDAAASRVYFWNRDGRPLDNLFFYGAAFHRLFTCQKSQSGGGLSGANEIPVVDLPRYGGRHSFSVTARR